MEEVLISGVIGLVAGVLGGMAGIGGSLIMLPGLGLLLGYDPPARQHLYMAAAMCVNLFVALPATLQHHRAGAIRFDLVKRILPAMLIAGVGGVLLSNEIEGTVLKRLLAIFIAAYCALNVVRVLRKRTESDPAPERATLDRLLVIGGLTGVVGGLLGLGGGVVMVPLLQVMGRIRLRQAIAVSATVMCVTAVINAAIKVATIGQHHFGVLDVLWLVLALGPAAVLGSSIGARLIHHLPINVVRIVISILLFASAVKLADLI